MAYSAKVMDHFANPRNVGEMKDCSVLAEQAIKAAVADYYRNQGIDPTPIVGELTECEECACDAH